MRNKKETKMMKVACAFAIAALITMACIGGVFAKYITEAISADNARVAYWGINAVSSVDLFKTEYDGAVDPTNTVVSANTDKVIAPGTEGSSRIGITSAGVPEVAYKVVSLIAVESEGFGEYNPVQLSLDGGINWLSLNEFEGAINAEFEKTIYPGGTTPDDITISWRWLFEVDDATDVLDTELGNMIVAPSLTITAELKAVQID